MSLQLPHPSQSKRSKKILCPDNVTAKFLYTIIKQLDLKNIDWNQVAAELDITNGHAARMRYSRFKTQIEGLESTLKSGRGGEADRIDATKRRRKKIDIPHRNKGYTCKQEDNWGNETQKRIKLESRHVPMVANSNEFRYFQPGSISSDSKLAFDLAPSGIHCPVTAAYDRQTTSSRPSLLPTPSAVVTPASSNRHLTDSHMQSRERRAAMPMVHSHTIPSYPYGFEFETRAGDQPMQDQWPLLSPREFAPSQYQLRSNATSVPSSVPPKQKAPHYSELDLAVDSTRPVASTACQVVSAWPDVENITAHAPSLHGLITNVSNCLDENNFMFDTSWMNTDLDPFLDETTSTPVLDPDFTTIDANSKLELECFGTEEPEKIKPSPGTSRSEPMHLEEQKSRDFCQETVTSERPSEIDDRGGASCLEISPVTVTPTDQAMDCMNDSIASISVAPGPIKIEADL